LDRIEKLKDFLRQDPDDSFVQHALALEYIKTGDDSRAQELFEEILTREPGYVGSYYHLAKLFERRGDTESATRCYEKGMEQARRAGDKHAYDELRSAYEELTF
jgi:Tfp pilus assembly protein PilF